MGDLNDLILRFISDSPFKVNFSLLKRHFIETYQTNPKELKLLVSGLVQAGELFFTSHYGSSFIELSYNRPRLVSEHVVIKPSSSSWNHSSDQWVISLKRGASFGGGEHPSTQLAIQLIDVILHELNWQGRKKALRAIDIGTGSGVLAIVAAKMGIGTVCGIDTDPCAVFEAGENVILNHLQNRVNILNGDLMTISGSFDLVIANLRAPTLMAIREILEKKMPADSVLVFSGLKSEETKPLYDLYKKAGFFLFQERVEKGWGAICLARGALFDEATPPAQRH